MREIIVAIFVVSMSFGYSQNKSKVSNEKAIIKTEELAMFGVRGNCYKCKAAIQEAAYNIRGVNKAYWYVKEKKLFISFDNTKTSKLEVQEAIAITGYDTEKVKANEIAYNNLPVCCQYDSSMEMDQDCHHAN